MYRKMNLQFFAENGGEGNQGNNEQGSENNQNNTNQNNNNQDNSNNNDQNNNNNNGNVGFSQEEVNGMLAREKAQGRAALLKELGFENIDDLKDIVSKHNEQIQKQMTPEQKLDQQNRQLTADLMKEKVSRQAAEFKVAAMKAGVNPELVDDFVILAMAKKTDDKTFDAVVAEMKVSNAFYFVNKEEDEKGQKNKNRGTRGNVGNQDNKKDDKNSDKEYVSRFFKNKQNEGKNRSTYFTN